jgi:hypothetical protein
MGVHKVTFEIESRTVSMIVNEGVLATMEVGKKINKVLKPEHRACVIVGSSIDEPVAWVQVSKAQNGSFVTTDEGWIGISHDMTGSMSSGKPPRGKIEAASQAEAQKQIGKSFGSRDCCTSDGDGCYVTCCNSCCSDPTACPGASCCS